MTSNTISYSIPPTSLKLLAAAPHRLLFCVGASNVLLAMLWWALQLIDLRWQVFRFASTGQPIGWMHATLMQYQVLPAFMFGFLLTVFPRWMNLPAFEQRHYVPVGAGLLLGQLCTLLGLTVSSQLLYLGAALTLSGWGVGVALLGTLVLREKERTWHAWSCLLALLLGWLGFALYAAFLKTQDAHAMFTSIKVGTFGLLLPIFFTVGHRMIPFFAGCVFRGYRPVRPMWALVIFWIAVIAHLCLELTHLYMWLWLADLPLTALAATLLWAWWPRQSKMPALLQVLFIGFAWLPMATMLYSVQSLWYVATGQFVLGRAPVHALLVGCFGSLLVAMVTRVTQGHSGRLLELGRVAGFAFIAVQVTAVLRIAAEFAPDSLLWQAVAACGWLAAFAPWVVRNAGIYLAPRIDGNPG